MTEVLFATPEQRVLRALLAAPTTAMAPAEVAERAGVPVAAAAATLERLELSGMVLWKGERALLAGEHPAVRPLKVLSALCDLETFQGAIEAVSDRGVLFGSRATGASRTGSDYDLFVVASDPELVRRAGAGHPLSREVELVVWTPEEYLDIESRDPGLVEKLGRGIPLWGAEL